MTLPLFSPADTPGPDFARLLDRLGLAHRVPEVGSFERVTHGTTIVALRYADGVLMAGDRRATAGSDIAHRNMDKVFPADRFSGIAIAGAAGIAVEMVRLFQTQLEHYEKLSGNALSLEGKANQLAQMIRGNMRHGHAGVGCRAAVRRLRHPARRWPHLHLRRDRRPVRRVRLPCHRFRRARRPHDDQARLAYRHEPRRGDRTGGAGAVRSGRRRLGHRRPRRRARHLSDGGHDHASPASLRSTPPRSPSASPHSSPAAATGARTP